jgi:pyruvate formate lyase activating enzyme
MTFDSFTVPTKHWHRLDDGRIQCDVCPRACKLREGQRGLCFVRARVDDQIVLTSYGRSSGFCVDPVEKKPLNHFLPGSAVLSFGTAGCNLACKFCQNWDISKSRETDTLADRATPADLARVADEMAAVVWLSRTTTQRSSGSTRPMSRTLAANAGSGPSR